MLDRTYFAGDTTFDAIDRRLTRALDRIGFRDTGRYATEGGFVLVTRMERFRSDGRSWAQVGRFDMADRRAVRLGQGFEIADYMRALFTAPAGRYRVLAFVVSDQPVVQSSAGTSAMKASNWVASGGASLPHGLGAQTITRAHRVTALIYEYVRPPSGEPGLQRPGILQGGDHLDRMGLLRKLRR